MKRTLLLMSVLAVAPLYAAAPNAADFAVMPAVAAPAQQMTPAARAAACGALAALPASTDSFMVLGNIGSMIADVQQKQGLPADPQMMAMAQSVDSIAIGLSDAAAADLQKYAPLMGRLRTAQGLQELGIQWGQASESPIPSETADALNQEALAEAMAAGKELRLAPIQLAVSFKGENAAQTAAMVKGMLMMGVTGPQTTPVTADGTPVSDMGAVEGIMVDLAALAENEEVAKFIGDRKLYVMLKQMGNALVLTVTSDLAAVQYADGVNASLAATAKAAAFDAHMDKSLVAAVSKSAALQKAEQDSNISSLNTLVSMVAGTFEKLAAANSVTAPTYAQAAQAAQTLAAELGKAATVGSNPATMTVWRDEKHVVVEAEADANGAAFNAGTLHQTTQALADDTMLYVEGTGMTCPCHADCATMKEAAGKLAEGVIATLTGDARLQVESAKAQLEPFGPVAEKALAALGTMGSGMGDGSALILSKAATKPENEGEPEMPTLSWQTPLTNRAALAQGWTELTAAVNELETLMGEEETIMNALPVETTEADGTTYYVVDADDDDDGDLVPTAAVNDTTLTLSSTARMARTLTGSGTEVPFAGAVFNINLQPIAETVRGMAKVFGVVEYDEETDSMKETENEDMIQAADALDAISTQIKNVGGSIRIINDRCHVEIIFHLR